MQANAKVIDESAKVSQRPSTWSLIFVGASVLLLLFLAFYNLTNYPVTWFDEGSHLHVPKALLHFGVYADYSSDGFRYFGPTIGVGPTVMLPIAASFKLFGIGLLQARVVMVIYLLAAISVFAFLARMLGGNRFAFVATALVVLTPGVGLIEYGRQVLGEVPGMFFLLAGMALWFPGWGRQGWWRLAAVGLLFGLSMVTKNQYLLVLGPTLLLAWVVNLLYYRLTPQRVFLVPGIVAGACFALWQVYTVVYLGPATASENLQLLREATAGAALAFSPTLMRRSLQELFSLKVYLAGIIPILIYGAIVSIPKAESGQKWAILYLLVVVNLVWYVTASVSWLRYAFPGLVVGSLFLARFFADLTGDFVFPLTSARAALRERKGFSAVDSLRMTGLVWLALLLGVSAGATVMAVSRPPMNAPAAMAVYMDANVPLDAVVETWEPEMGFLTDHNYHYPPSGVLAKAVSYMWLDSAPPSESYQLPENDLPPYILIGTFSEWVKLYPDQLLDDHYRLLTKIGAYRLYELADDSP